MIFHSYFYRKYSNALFQMTHHTWNSSILDAFDCHIHGVDFEFVSKTLKTLCVYIIDAYMFLVSVYFNNDISYSENYNPKQYTLYTFICDVCIHITFNFVRLKPCFKCKRRTRLNVVCIHVHVFNIQYKRLSFTCLMVQMYWTNVEYIANTHRVSHMFRIHIHRTCLRTQLSFTSMTFELFCKQMNSTLFYIHSITYFPRIMYKNSVFLFIYRLIGVK